MPSSSPARHNAFWLALLAAFLPMPALAQEHDHAAMDHSANVPPDDIEENTCILIATIPSRVEGSGTSLLPASEGTSGGCGVPARPHPPGGLHVMARDWMIMAHGTVSLQYTDHSGPRGDDQAYATSMVMLTGEREGGWGRIQLKSMLSLEPLMDARGYPNLLASGETARGAPLVDRQHPHDLFMELAARVDVNLGGGASLYVYGGPVGEPALGPSAFMMRRSARYNPEPPIAHHWFDSTHITYGVVTLGARSGRWQLEASSFRGREPDERRWNIETPKLDSWSARATWTPTSAWAIQASYAQIHEPEALHPGQDERRFTASAHFTGGRGLAAMLAFSARDRAPGRALTAWLAEANWDLDRRNTVFGRFENVANDEFFPDHADPLHDRAFRVSKLQIGYARRISLVSFELALGGSVSAYSKPKALDAAYGREPWGYTLFARLML